MKLLITYFKSILKRLRYMFQEETTDIVVPPRIWQQRMHLCRNCDSLKYVISITKRLKNLFYYIFYRKNHKPIDSLGTYVCDICSCPIADKCRYASEECAKTKFKKWFQWRVPKNEKT